MATPLFPFADAIPVIDYAALRQRDLDHERMFLETDAYVAGLPAPQKAAMDSWLSWSPDPAADTRKSVVRGYVGDFYDLPDEGLENGGYEAHRDRYAREVLGVPYGGAVDDNSFFELVKGERQKSRDFRIQSESFSAAGIASALKLEPGDSLADMAKMRESAASVEGFDAGQADKFTESYRSARQQIEAQAGPLRPVAREIFAGLSKGKLERFGDESQAAIETAIDQLAALPEDQRGLVVAMLKAEGGSDSNTETAGKAGSAAIRGLTGQLRGFASNLARSSILAFQSGTAEIYEGMTAEESFRRTISGNGPGISESRATRKPTEEEAKTLKALADQALTRSDVAAQAIAIMEGTLDPITTSGLGQKIAVNVGASLGAMAPIALPYAGVVIAQGGYADAEYQRQRSMGTDPGTAHTAAQITGTVQAGLERAAFLFSFVPASTLGKLTPKFTSPGLATSFPAQIAGRMATVQAAEYTEEIAQAGAPILTAALGERLGWSLPEQARMGEELKRWKVLDADTFMTVAALSLVGGGFHGVKNTVQAREAMTAQLADPLHAQSLGVKPEAAASIAALPEAEQIEAFKAAYAGRDPSTPEAAAAQQQLTDRTKAAIQEGQAEVAAMQDEGLTITRTTEGFSVTDQTDGTTIEHATAEEAMQTARAVMTERGSAREDTFLDALGEFTGMMQPGRTIQLSPKSGNLLKELEDASAEGREKTVTAIWDRADQYRQSQGEEALARDMENPDSRNALEGLLVLGRSTTEAQGNAARSISLIMREGRTLDLVEEQAENDLREAVQAGKTSLSAMRGIVKRIEAATGDKYLFSDTETGVTEAWSSLVRLYTTGTRKGNKITAGARAEMASDFRRQRRKLREAEGQGVTPSAFAKMREYLDHLKSIMGQVSRLMKAKADGKLDDLEAMIRESVGLKEQDAHEAKVIESVPTEYNLPEGWENADVGFAITTAERLNNVADTLASKARDPESRFKMYATAKERLSGMARAVAYNDSVAGAVTSMEVERQRIARKKETLIRLHDEIDADFGDLSGAEFVSKTTNNPIIEALVNFPKGKGGLPKGRLKTRQMDLPGGEYDGSDAIPRWLFGGSLAPDLAAQELFEAGLLNDPSPDAMWTAIESALQTTNAAKARLEAYAMRRREARNEATQEAAAWADGELAKVPKRGTEAKRADMLRFLSALDTILMPFPAEVRGKVGGFVKLAGLRSNTAMETYLKKRVEKLDAVLETFMRKEYTEAMGRLLKKAEPTKGKPGEKMAGKLGPDTQHLLDKMKEAMRWTDDKVTAHIAGLDALIAGGTLTAEQEALALREIELVQLAGNWYPRGVLTGQFGVKGQALTRSVYDGLPAAQMAAALKAAEDTYDGGFQAWSAKLTRKREAREVARTALIADTGKAGTTAERDARAQKDLGWMGKAKDFWLSLSSFEEVVSYVFGKDSAAGRNLTDLERAAAYQYEDATAAMGDRVLEHFAALAGGHLKGEQLRFRLSQKSIKTASGELSELEAIQALLLWKQEDGQRHMIGHLDENNKPAGAWHYDQAWVDDVASQMTPEGKATMAFIQRIYGDEWATLNPLYRERHGVNLPRHENYAPITVAPQQAKGGEMVDPVSGAALAGSILTPGSLRTRSRSAIAEPEFRDALQTMLAHTKQMEHWKAYYDFAVDAQAILGNREVGNAVQAAGGKEGKLILRKWIDLFSQGGNRDAGAALSANRALASISGRAARMALVGRVGTLLIQSTQLAAASAEIPASAYIVRLGKLLSGNLGWGDAMRSDFIQRRIQQAPPIVRQAMEGLASDKPNVVKQAAAKLGTLISGADGLFTAGTYAILLDYHRAQAAKLGIAGPAADAYAHGEAERLTERVAQPTRMGARSLFENTSTNPLAKLGWAFASEARQKIALAAWAARNAKVDPARAARVAMLTWGVGGLMAQVIRNSWKDLRDDDDDELFDSKNWSLGQLIYATLAGPLQGIPGFGQAIQEAIAAATGTYSPNGDLLSGLGRGVPAIKGLLSGDSAEDSEPVEEIMKDVEAILTTAGMMNETAASATSLFHLIRDGANIIDGFRDDEGEEADMDKRARSRSRKDAREARKED